MRIFRYLLQHKAALLLVFVLLMGQAVCDLMLPSYTSDIVDVGIQQQGVEDVAATDLSVESYQAAYVLADDAGRRLMEEGYAFDGEQGHYVLTEAGKDNRVQLDEALVVPLAALCLASDDDVSTLSASVTNDAVSGAEVAACRERVLAATQDLDASLLEQQAITFVQGEYARLGLDVNAMQLTYLLRTGGLMLLVAALSVLASILIGFIASRTGTLIGRTLREQLFARVVAFSDAEINSFSAASLITRGTNDIQLIQMVCIIMQRMVLYAPILAIGGIVMVVTTTPSLWWIVGIAVVCVLVLVAVLMGITMPKFRMVQKLIDRVNLIAREQLTGLSVVRAFGREGYEEERFEGANATLMGTQLFTNRAMAFMMPSMMLIMNATSVLIVWVGAGFVDLGTVQTGDLIALITYSMMIVMSFLMLGMVAILLPRATVAAGRVDEVIATELSIADPVQPASVADEGAGVSVEFRDVSFRYADDSADVLEHVSFAVPAGSTFAIIGSTGSGKSTILKLIERFHDATSGTVLVGGTDVRDLPQETLRGLFGYVPQKAFLFSGTIGSNVAYGGTTDDDQVRLALEVAQAAEFVASKEQGLDAEVAQGGTNVSGGQRQRLAMARALATGAKGYLFDDSFSALDYKTDAALRRGLQERLGERTVIIVAQRIATVMHADAIVVLDEGRVVGQGTHEELLATCDEYRDIALSQLSAEELFGVDASARKGGDER